MRSVVLGIEGMSCAACSGAIEKYLSKQKGVAEISVNLVMANASVTYDENLLTLKDIELFIRKSGYKSTGIYKPEDDKKQERQKTALIAFGIACLIVLYISMGTMINLPVPPYLDMHKFPIVYSSVVFTLTVPFLIYGGNIFIKGVKTLFHGAPNMDTLVTVGVAASFIYSVVSYIMLITTGEHFYVERLYFESCAVIVYFIKLGRYIDGASKNKTRQAVKDLVKITPEYAYIKVDGELKKVGIHEIKKGDTVCCKAGEKIAVDGVITSGYAHLDQSFITGESKPAKKGLGESVVAGSINLDGYIEYSAEKIGKDSTVSEIVRLVVEASNTKMPIARVADKVSGVFVPAVFVIAIITLAVYLIIGKNFGNSLTAFVTVLVVACPCSLGLATPIAVVVSEGTCAKRGILVKKSQATEFAAKADTVIFDKTGTLTYGKLKIAEFANFSGYDDKTLFAYACSAESLSSHPIGGAFTLYAKENGISLLNTDNHKNIAGMGISCDIDGKQILLGNAAILQTSGIENPHKQQELTFSKDGNSIVYIAVDNKLSGIFGVNDALKGQAADTVAKLNAMGIETVMLTGDNKNAAEIFAAKAGIKKVIAGVMPSEKAKVIKELKAKGKKVIMCGDGINDSPALTLADVGVSLKGSTDIAMNSADVILMSDIEGVADFIKISRKTVRNIKQNLFWAFFYNALMIPVATGIFAFAGLTITPMIAGIAMTLSSLSVVLNALRLRTVKTEKEN